MIDPTSFDWAGNNTSRQQRKLDNRWLLIASLIVGGLLFSL